MQACRHQRLTLLMPSTEVRLRCRRCHLTLAEDEAAGGPCPECLEATGVRRADYERVEITTRQTARARCEDCGLLMDAE